MGLFDKIKELLNRNPFKEKFKINRLRPPGAVEEKQFMERCIRCARCIAVCPYKCIERGGAGDGAQVGTPYVYPEKKACYMCMLCTQVCPTGALDPSFTQPAQTRMGIARINETTCLNYLYAKDEEKGFSDGVIGLLCNTCVNVCPFPSEAIYLEDHIKPVIMDKCTGCGICVERCPLEPVRAISVLPTGMPDAERAGLHYLRSRRGEGATTDEVLHGQRLLEEKSRLSSEGGNFDFKYDFNTDNSIHGWNREDTDEEQ